MKMYYDIICRNCMAAAISAGKYSIFSCSQYIINNTYINYSVFN
jgi:hypothetical protein